MNYKTLIIKTFNNFSDDKATKLSGSLAYSAIFSLPPMLLLIIVSGGYLYGEEALQGKIFSSLNHIVGEEVALQIQDVIKALYIQNNSVIATIIGVAALIIGATGVFTEIQGSLNLIWGVRSKPKKGILKLVLNRILSFSMIIGLGFLMIIFLIADAVILSFGSFILSKIPWLPINLITLLNQILLFLVLTFLFAFIFKVLPDIRLKWKNVIPGAVLTTLLFMAGKFFINLYVSRNNIISLYGAASSVIILMVWVYFSSLILFLGAEFSKTWILEKGITPIPSKYAEKTGFFFRGAEKSRKKQKPAEPENET